MLARIWNPGVDFPLVHGSAEDVPLQDCSFDIVFCDHGAMTFADPLLTVPEAATFTSRRSVGVLGFHAIPLRLLGRRKRFGLEDVTA
jgi:ubiquinone/menaquinone biosynthesis C-methylase UbiE